MNRKNNSNNQILYNTILTNLQKAKKKKIGGKLESHNVLPYIKKIITDTSPNSPKYKYIKDGLIYLYSNHFGQDQVVRRSKESINKIKIRIKKQLDVLEKNSVTANEKISVELSDDQEIDILFLIWCDMIHDQNISVTNDNRSFSKFINSDIAKKLFGDDTRTFIYTNYIKNLLGILIKNPTKDNKQGQDEFFFKVSSGNNIKDILKGITASTKPSWTSGWWEKIWKREIIQTVSYNSNQNGENYEKNTLLLHPNEIKPELFKRQILVSIDQEPNTSKNVSSALFRSKSVNTHVKLLQPTISLANLIDPGSNMVKNSINANKSFLDASNTNTNQIRSKVRWNIIPYEFKLGGMNIKTELVERGKPHVKNFKYTYDYEINNKKYISNVAKGTGNKTDDSISKFAGDFYQILTALRMQKAGQLYVPASGDGMFCVIYAYLAKYVYKTTPRIIFIKDRGGTEPTNLVFLNLKEYMNNINTRSSSTRVFTEKRKFNSISSSISGSNSNSNNEVSSTNRSIIKKARNAVNQNARNEAIRKARNAAIQKANANAIQKARNEAIRKARNAANQKARNAAIQNANANANQKARNAVNQNAKANEKQNARNAANQKAKRNEFIKKIKKFTNLDNRTKRGFILGFNNGENANNLLKQAERDNKNKKEGLAAIRKQTLRKR